MAALSLWLKNKKRKNNLSLIVTRPAQAWRSGMWREDTGSSGLLSPNLHSCFYWDQLTPLVVNTPRHVAIVTWRELYWPQIDLGCERDCEWLSDFARCLWGAGASEQCSIWEQSSIVLANFTHADLAPFYCIVYILLWKHGGFCHHLSGQQARTLRGGWWERAVTILGTLLG